MISHLFLDMDGCLVDLEEGYKNHLKNNDPHIISELKNMGFDVFSNSLRNYEDALLKYYSKGSNEPKKLKEAKFRAKAKFWKLIQGKVDFWTGLDWMPDGKELFEYCLNLKNELALHFFILSSPSSDPMCEVGKRAWLQTKGISKYFEEIIIDKHKSPYAKAKSYVLIDDTIEKINGWIANGGTGILHKNTKDTIKQLEELKG